MPILTNADAVEFRRLAQTQGRILTEAEAMVLATRLILIYRLAMPTPSELRTENRRHRADRIISLLKGKDAMERLKSLKRGHGRAKNRASLTLH
jgi:hypothetical protein